MSKQGGDSTALGRLTELMPPNKVVYYESESGLSQSPLSTGKKGQWEPDYCHFVLIILLGIVMVLLLIACSKPIPMGVAAIVEESLSPHFQRRKSATLGSMTKRQSFSSSCRKKRKRFA